MGRGKKIFNGLDASAYTTGKTETWAKMFLEPAAKDLAPAQVLAVGGFKIVGHPDMPANKFLLICGASAVEGEIQNSQ